MINEEFSIDNSEINAWLLEYRITGDEKIKKKLKGLITMAYMPLVTKVARSFARRSVDPIEDIVQVGSIGLLKAVDLYSSEKNTGFKTYANYLITSEIRHYLRDKISMIRAPRGLKELSYRVHKITLELTQKYGAPPTDQQLVQALQMPQQTIEEIIELDRRTSIISVDQIAALEPYNSKSSSIVEKIPDERSIGDDEIFENKIILEEAINSLSEQHQEIVKMHFYEGLSQREISKKLNISQMQVSRKMKKALSNLFKFVSSRGVEPYE